LTLVIRSEQMNVFERAAFESFVAQLADHLLQHHADAFVHLPDGTSPAVGSLPRIALEDLVRFGIARAKMHRLTLGSTISAFVAIMFAVAPNFDSVPLLAAILAAPLDQRGRIRALIDFSTAADWQRASMNYDRSLWPLGHKGA
jgi:hypothetical protein